MKKKVPVEWIGGINIINWDEVPLMAPSKPYPLPVLQQIRSTKLVRISPDEKYEEDVKNGSLILITNPKYNVTGTKRSQPNTHTMDGIFSPMFGQERPNDPQRFSCFCRSLTGVQNRGKICPNCGGEVEEIKNDISKMGYIDIEPYHILSIQGYYALKPYIKNLDEILTSIKPIDVKGKAKKDSDDGKHKLGYIDGEISLITIYERYDEDFYPLTKIDKKYVFISKIPVSHPKLRPLIERGTTTVSQLPQNKRYLSILSLREHLYSASISGLKSTVPIERCLNKIAVDWLGFIESKSGNNGDKKDTGICEICATTLSGKRGRIRQIMTSGRVDECSRMIISLGQDLRPHEIRIPYHTAMVLYEDEIVHWLRIHDPSLNSAKAISIVRKHTHSRNKKMISIINNIFRSGFGVWGFGNRNPTILELGIQYVRVVGLTDEHLAPGQIDETMQIAADGLTPYNADFDGDQMTFMKADKEDHPYLLEICPTYFFIDRITGKFNRMMGFNKDYAAILETIWSIGSACEEYAKNPSDESYHMLTEVHHVSSPHSLDERTSMLIDDNFDPIYKNRAELDEYGIRGI